MNNERRSENMYTKNSIDYKDYNHGENNHKENNHEDNNHEKYDCGENYCRMENENDGSELNVPDKGDMLTDCECLDLLDDFEENLDELEILAFFNEFTLVDISLGDFIREVYFED